MNYRSIISLPIYEVDIDIVDDVTVCTGLTNPTTLLTNQVFIGSYTIDVIDHQSLIFFDGNNYHMSKKNTDDFLAKLLNDHNEVVWEIEDIFSEWLGAWGSEGDEYIGGGDTDEESYFNYWYYINEISDKKHHSSFDINIAEVVSLQNTDEYDISLDVDQELSIWLPRTYKSGYQIFKSDGITKIDTSIRTENNNHIHVYIVNDVVGGIKIKFNHVLLEEVVIYYYKE